MRPSHDSCAHFLRRKLLLGRLVRHFNRDRALDRILLSETNHLGKYPGLTLVNSLVVAFRRRTHASLRAWKRVVTTAAELNGLKGQVANNTIANLPVVRRIFAVSPIGGVRPCRVWDCSMRSVSTTIWPSFSFCYPAYPPADRPSSIPRQCSIQSPNGLIGIDALSGSLQVDADTEADKKPCADHDPHPIRCVGNMKAAVNHPNDERNEYVSHQFVRILKHYPPRGHTEVIAGPMLERPWLTGKTIKRTPVRSPQ